MARHNHEPRVTRPRVYVAGHRGLVGSAIVRRIARDGCEPLVRTHEELDLRRQPDVDRFFRKERPDHVYMAAATVGGIRANDTYPADFIANNIAIALNVIRAAAETRVRRLMFLGSSCAYPRLAPQPIHEDSLLTGELEPTNLPYAVAKIAGIELCRAYNRQLGTQFMSVMPSNVYGPGDNYDPDSSHVVAALIRKFHDATELGEPVVEVWGTGTPRREFLFADDLADACVFLMERPLEHDLINIGLGVDHTVSELAHMVADIAGFRGAVEFDPTKPDGTPRKLLDVSRLTAMGWRATTDLTAGLEETYEAFRATSIQRTE